MREACCNPVVVPLAYPMRGHPRRLDGPGKVVMFGFVLSSRVRPADLPWSSGLPILEPFVRGTFPSTRIQQLSWAAKTISSYG